MSDSPRLELTAQLPPGPREPRQVWYLMTNQLNLMFMLAAGLLIGPEGYGRKYYLDPLSVAPGWIPLFADPVPSGALEQATSEGKHLLGVAAAIDLSPLRGQIHAIDDRGNPRTLRWPDEASGDERILFVPAPLPIGWLRTILFRSKEVQATFREQAADYSNVPLNACKLGIKKGLYQSGAEIPWPPGGALPPARDHSLHHVSAVSAVQALLVGLGNRGMALVKAAQLLSEPLAKESGPGDDPLLNAMLQWAAGGGTARDEGEIPNRILRQLLTAIVGIKVEADHANRNGCTSDIYQAVLETLDAERQRLTEPKWRDALARLIEDLKGVLGLGDATISELLQKHSRPLSRGLALFFLRERCEELFTLAAEQPSLTDQDLMVAAALFGARGGWLGLPQTLKDVPGLAAAATHRMSAMLHRQQGSDLDLGPAPPRVQPLLELLQPGASGWTRRQREGALLLARRMDWQGILRTRISLGKGDYRLQVDGRGAHLLIDGDVKAIQVEVDSDILFQSLAKVAIPPKVDAEVRSILAA